MKRLAWLLLAVFCAALAQVQSADGILVQAKACKCCQVPGACGMPGCRPSSASMPAMVRSAQSSRATSSHACRKTQAVRAGAKRFYTPFIEAATDGSVPLGSARAAPVADVPLFKAHCSFLI